MYLEQKVDALSKKVDELINKIDLLNRFVVDCNKKDDINSYALPAFDAILENIGVDKEDLSNCFSLLKDNEK